jgi:hypothetical protein
MIGFTKVPGVAALLLALAPAAAAEESFPEKRFGSWTVYGWDESCWIATERADGTSVRISDSDKPGDVYLAFANPAWDWIEGGSQMEMTVRIGTADFEATGFGNARGEMQPGIGLFLDSSERSYLSLIRAAQSLTLTYQGKQVTQVTLDVPREGYDYYERCLATVDVYAKKKDA